MAEGFPNVELRGRKILRKAFDMLPLEYCEEICCIAFDFDRRKNILCVASSNPVDILLQGELELTAKCRVQIYSAEAAQIKQALEYFRTLYHEYPEMTDEDDIWAEQEPTID